MPYRYTLCQHTVPDWDPLTMIRNASAIGYDAVSIRGIRQGVPGEKFYPLLKGTEEFSAVKEALLTSGIRLHDLDLVSLNRDRDIPSLEPTLESAADLGVSGVVTSLWDTDTELTHRQFRELCELAGKYQLDVYLEFVTWAALKDLKGAAALLHETGASNARILVDTLHWHRSLVDVEDLEGCPREWFPYLHICDIASEMPDTDEELARTGRSERLLPGEGAAGIREIVRAIGGDPWMGIEIPHTERRLRLGSYEYAALCLKACRQYLEA